MAGHTVRSGEYSDSRCVHGAVISSSFGSGQVLPAGMIKRNGMVITKRSFAYPYRISNIDIIVHARTESETSLKLEGGIQPKKGQNGQNNRERARCGARAWLICID